MAVESNGVEAFARMVREGGKDRAEAICTLVFSLSKGGGALNFVYNPTAKKHVDYKIDGEIPYAFIVNDEDLLFYLRKATIGRVPDPKSLPVEERKDGERKCRIHNPGEALALMEELGFRI